MRLNNFWAVVIISICVFIVVFVVLSMGASEASGSCLRCFEPEPSAQEHKSDRGVEAYPGPLPPLPPTPHPYPGTEWADEYYPVPDGDGGHTWIRMTPTPEGS